MSPEAAAELVIARPRGPSPPPLREDGVLPPERHGRDRVAPRAAMMCFGPRGAIRDAAQVLGLTYDVTGALAFQVRGRSKEGA